MRTLALFVVCLLAGPSLWGDEPKDDLQLVQGTWEVLEFTANGKPIPEAERMGMKFEITDTTMTLKARNRESSFEIKLNSKVTPKTIDYKALEGTFKGKTNYGIYELNGDDLKLCMHNQDADKPPTEFKSVNGDKLALFVLRRAKAKLE